MIVTIPDSHQGSEKLLKPHKSNFKAEIPESHVPMSEASSPGDGYFRGGGQQIPAAVTSPAAAGAALTTAAAGSEDDNGFSTEFESANCSIHCFYKKEKTSQIVEDHFNRALNQESGNNGSASPNSEKNKGKFFGFWTLIRF